MTPLSVLIVEDSVDDTELLLHELRRGGYEPTYTRVENAEAMQAELSKQQWDIVISDFSLPKFDAFAALELLHGTRQDIPFIIVSGTIGEDRAVKAMKLGAHDYILKATLKRLVPAVERELREAHARLDQLKANETIFRLAFIDPITNLPNRFRFRELVQEAVETGKHDKQTIALLLMDLDNFRDVNDTLGHDRGDSLLQQVGLRLRSALFKHDVVARIGGDEFGILLPHLAAADDILRVIQNIHDSLSMSFMIEGIPIVVEASIGVALMPEHADNADTLLQRADIAMYHAKQMASNYAIYAPDLNPHSPERLGLMAELRDAVEHNQLLLHFQPKIDLKTSFIIGTEALVRWQHPRLGLLPPDRFILPAEQTGLIDPLTRWVLTDAMSHCQGARREGMKMKVSVNLSARSLHDPQLPHMITEVLNKIGAEPGNLILEVTESAIVLEPKRALENLVTLSRMGISLSIDDFGTGYTSLSSIKRLPVNEIKIDKSFVTNMLTDKQDAKIVRTIIEFGHNFGLNVVAEGVETKDVYHALADLGCDVVQGYYVSKPLSCEELKAWFSSAPYKISPVH